MKRMKVLVLFVCLSFFVVVATGAVVPGAPTLIDRKGAKSQIERGRSVFTSNCARCHGADGMGHTTMGQMTEAPNISDAAWQSRRSSSRMIASVSNGRGDMPAFKKKLSKQDIAAAVAYVRTLKR